MKLHILNDLHIEFEDFVPPVVDADVVILAGDIGVGMEGLRWAEARFPDRPVIYVPGNHEFYHHDIALVDELKEQAPEHIHVLNDDRIVIDGIRFLGCILWTDFSLFGEADKFFAMQQARQKMTDFSIIQDDGQRFSPEDAIRLHDFRLLRTPIAALGFGRAAQDGPVAYLWGRAYRLRFRRQHAGIFAHHLYAAVAQLSRLEHDLARRALLTRLGAVSRPARVTRLHRATHQAQGRWLLPRQPGDHRGRLSPFSGRR